MSGREARPVALRPFGEGAFLVELGQTVTAPGARRAARLAEALAQLRRVDPRWGVAVAGAASVLAPFDPLALDADGAERTLRGLVDRVPPEPEPVPDRRVLAVEVRFGGEDGPDLADVAARTGRSPDEVVARLAATELEVLFLGFAPGFPYLGPLPDALVVPRRSTPRIRVPAGSVAIAGPFAGIYPRESPGGWHVLGRSATRLFDPDADPPALLRPGDAVVLVPA